jgi:outer membrane protein OmpA-like peptidoglycan-associated protein
MAQTQDYLNHKQWKALPTAARDAVQKAEDARVLAVKRAQDEMVAQEKAAAAAGEAQAKAEAQAALVKQQQEAQARQQAEIQKLQAQVATAKAEQETAQQTQARKAAQEAAAKAEAEKQQLRATLLAQFNRVLPTTDTPRGLQANMGDVLFDTGKYALKSEARESLAKFTGIVLSHPGLTLAVEGYTDNVGSDTFNETLSQQRANSVRDYLIQQGLDPASITATGFGSTMPVASNDTPQGRQQNRRVEIIISGEVIGTKIGNTPPSQ